MHLFNIMVCGLLTKVETSTLALAVNSNKFDFLSAWKNKPPSSLRRSAKQIMVAKSHQDGKCWSF